MNLIWRVFELQGVIIEVGDVIRLGRVCYIVKESSIALGEQALKMCESYAQSKANKWDSIMRSQRDNSMGISSAIIEKSSNKSPSNHDPVQQTDVYDALEDYFNTALGGADNTNLRSDDQESG